MKNLIMNKAGAEFRLNGEIVADDMKEIYEFYGYQVVAPKDINKVIDMLKGEDLTIKINSPGGDVPAGSEMYTELRSYRGKVIIKVDGIAASAASVVAMAADKGQLLMSPTSLMMIHNVWTQIAGDYRDMDHASEMLKSANQAVARAYMDRTGLSETTIKRYMDNESWFSAAEAVDLRFADRIMFAENEQAPDIKTMNVIKTRMAAMYNSIPKLSKEAIDEFKNKKSDKNEKKGYSYAEYMLKLIEMKGELNW